MAEGKFVAYYRVSTAKQGASGLGLAAQQETVRHYLNGGKWSLVAEFTEFESGKRNDRPALDASLAKARLHRAPLVVAKVDRLTRSLSFLTRLLDSGVDVRFCDLPKIEGPTGRFILQQMASVAELEAGFISDRTKKALKAAKARGKKLGGNRGVVISAEARRAGVEAVVTRSIARAADLKPVIDELRRGGVATLSAIAEALTAKGIPTARGGARWSAVQVQRVLARLRS
jgi:DNA invertase Pin-like site-specific DNA recombinase